MKWVEFKKAAFKYNGKPVIRRKMIAKTIVGDFEVFESVGGNVFYRHPFVRSNYINPLTGFNNGLEEWFGKSKWQCKSIEDGIKICEEVISKIKDSLNKTA